MKIDTVAIPLAYSEDEQTFFKYLYNAASSIEPQAVIPKAKERVRTYCKGRQDAA